MNALSDIEASKQLEKKLARHLKRWAGVAGLEPPVEQVNEYIAVLEEMFEGHLEWPHRVSSDWHLEIIGKA